MKVSNSFTKNAYLLPLVFICFLGAFENLSAAETASNIVIRKVWDWNTGGVLLKSDSSGTLYKTCSGYGSAKDPSPYDFMFSVDEHPTWLNVLNVMAAQQLALKSITYDASPLIAVQEQSTLANDPLFICNAAPGGHFRDIYFAKVTAIDFGDHDADALPSDFEIVNGRNPVDADYQIAAGGQHACFLGDNGVQCWGRYDFGQAPNPSGSVSGLSPAVDLDNPVILASGRTHSCAVDDTDDDHKGDLVKCWGYDGWGQANPNPLPLAEPILAIKGGEGHTCAIDSSGTGATTAVKCWGLNLSGQVSPSAPLSFPVNAAVNGLVNPSQISLGNFFSCALDDDGVKCWGQGYTGVELIDDDATPTTSGVVYPDLISPVAIAAGTSHVCVLDNAMVKCWGTDTNSDGRLSPPATTNPRSIVAVDNHSCVLDDNGVKCWGENPMGGAPAVVSGLVHPAQISVGSAFGCALDSEGVKCWGDNWFAQKNPPTSVGDPVDPDGDGLNYSAEVAAGTKPFLKDTDGDTVNDHDDAFPLNPAESADADGDGVGNIADSNDDNDCYADDVDPTPFLSGTMQAGDLDCTLSNDGVVTQDFASAMDRVMAIAKQADGKLIAVGSSDNSAQSKGYDFAIARFNIDGSLDTTYCGSGTACAGGNGKILTHIDGGTPAAVDNYATTAIVGQVGANAGKLIVAGYSNLGNGNHFTVIRYNSDGSVDTAFGMPSFQFLYLKNAYANAVLEQPDGKIVIAGYTETSTKGRDFAVARMNPDGTMDSGFNTGGVNSDGFWNNVGTRTNNISTVGTKNDEAYSMVRQSDGKLVLAGSSCTIGSGSTCTDIDVALVRYKTDGTLDSGFDGDGKLTTSVSISTTGTKDDVAKSIIQQVDGQLLVGGYSNNSGDGGTGDDLLLIRYNLVDGGFDVGFCDPFGSCTGKWVYPAGDNDRINGLVQQADDKLVFTGSLSNATDDDIILARLNLDGALDIAKVISVGNANDAAQSVCLQSDGKSVIAGYTNNGSNDDFVLLRYFLQTTDADTDGADDFIDACPLDNACQ